MADMLSILEGIELNKKIDLLERLILAVDVKKEPFDELKAGCLGLSASMNIIKKYIQNESDKELFEGVKDQVIAIFDKKSADIDDLKFIEKINIVKAKFEPSPGGADDK